MDADPVARDSGEPLERETGLEGPGTKSSVEFIYRLR
jgi:hypothetical protein